jgi:hypothetical protein
MKHWRKLATFGMVTGAALLAVTSQADPHVTIYLQPKVRTFQLQPKAQTGKVPARPGPKTADRTTPRLIAVAETKLLMEGLTLPNFRGLEKLLQNKPKDVESWTFARGQALLIAETGNLLMLRPPHNPGEKVWLSRASALRASATALARVLAQRDFDKSRKALGVVATRCNACHQTFRVKVRITPFAKKDKDAEEEE